MMRIPVLFLVFLYGTLMLPCECHRSRSKCSSPPGIKSARLMSMEVKSSYDEGEYVRYKCRDNFDALSDVKVSCNQNGQWSKPRYGCNKCFGHWALIFRAKSRIGGEPSRIFTDSDVASEKSSGVPDGCSSRNVATHCYSHYRSSLIDDWGLLSNKNMKVKVELLTSKGNVANVVFNGRGSTSTNWFDKNRIQSSSWTDIKAQRANIFSMYGDNLSDRSREWMMNYVYGGCNGDIGWMIGIEKTGPCPIDKQRKFPAFFYSPYTVKTHYQNYQEADVMAIYVEADGLCN